ncbi:BamA/TamA family outer membrane protein [Fodinibius sediminis]|uniref:Surface antigen n=1 Tax=Fodinibius sediminis TaxID=1214077 RepID=A0A521C4Q0_9BACT|nr:BamA/TamA family outer membrane protein [Fodinibius sediminis]SMO54457.1 Surface antigen [Fodinibius sediminis]
MIIKKTLLLLGLIAATSATTLAQSGNTGGNADSLSSALVPAAGYSSNEGVIGGIIYSRYDYRGEMEPFRSHVKASALASTRGYVKFRGAYEQTETFGRPIRSTLNLYFNRFTSNNFFGIGNEVPFDKKGWEEGFFYFESVGFGLGYELRKPLYRRGRSRLDLLAGAETEYQIPYVSREPSSFSRQQPRGRRGGWLNFLKTGFVWENRDREFDPQHGNRLALELRYAPDLVSRYAMGTARAELRQYFKLFDEITVANLLEARHAMGDVPYWERSTLADGNTLRGYPLNRFQGNSSVAYTLELRSWLFEFPQFYRLKLGMQLFTDTGRVFTEEDDFGDLFKGYKQTIGVGGALSILNPDFILRGEIGFSSDVSRIYVGVGYLF